MIRKLIYKLTFSKIPCTEFLRVVILENSAVQFSVKVELRPKDLAPLGCKVIVA